MSRRRRVSEIIEVGASDDIPSRCYDFASTLILLINVAVTVMYTFDSMEQRYGGILLLAEALTIAFFAVDYGLRLWTAQIVRPGLSEAQAVWRYFSSFTGIVDLLSWLPYYLPVFFPAGAAVFRLFRVVRIFRLFQINAYYDSLNIIGEVISSKRQQLLRKINGLASAVLPIPESSVKTAAVPCLPADRYITKTANPTGIWSAVIFPKDPDITVNTVRESVIRI